MQHEQEIRILNELFDQIDRGVNVDAGVQLKNPTKAYICPEQAALEYERFFREHVQVIGLSGDLPKPDSYITLNDFGVPILAVRDRGGNFRAFLNACRHRGTELVSERRGETPRFVCPFHGWTYGADGDLKGVSQAEDFGAVDKNSMGLVELPAVEHAGFLMVHPQPDGEIDVSALLDGLAPELLEANIGHHVLCGEQILDKPLNWKLANDTFGETYHFKRLHRNTLGNLFIGDALSYEPFGRNHRFVFPSKGIMRLKSKPQSEWSTENITTVLYYLFPNIEITISKRQITLFRIYPIAGHPGRSRSRVSHYFSEQALAEIASGKKTVIAADNVYDPKSRDGNAIIAPEAAMELLDSTVENEDYKMGESTQRSIESGLLEHIIFGRNEPALHHFHNTFRAALEMPPLETVVDGTL